MFRYHPIRTFMILIGLFTTGVGPISARPAPLFPGLPVTLTVDKLAPTVGDPGNISYISQLGQNEIIPSLAIQGNYAYAAIDPQIPEHSPGLAVLNLSDPVHPVQVGFLPMPAQPADVFVSGTYAYAYDNYSPYHAGRIWIIDISNPAAPTEVGRLIGCAVEAVEGDTAYVDDCGLLRVVDISDPTSPQEVATIPYGYSDVEVADGYLYAQDGIGLNILDISNPAAPVSVSFLTVEGYYIHVRGGFAYIAWGRGCVGAGCWSSGGIHIVDVSDPLAPLVVNEISGGGWAGAGFVEAFEVEGKFIVDQIFPSDWTGIQYEVYELVTPVEAEFRGYLADGYPVDLAASGDYAYLAYGNLGLTISTVITGSFLQVGSYGTQQDMFKKVAVAGNYAFLSGENVLLEVVDVTNPYHPVEIASLAGSASALAVVDGYAYIGDESGLQILDISDPIHPSQIGFYPTPDVNDIAILGSHAYLASSFDLQVLDVSDPTQPIFKGSLELGVDCNIKTPGQVSVNGDIAYLTWYQFSYPKGESCDIGGLSLVDISDPSHLTQVSSLNLGYGSYPETIAKTVSQADAFGRKYVYVAGSSLWVIDVTDSGSPFVAGSLDVSARGLALSGDHLYTVGDISYSTYTGELQTYLHVVDVSQPMMPQEVSAYQLPVPALDVATGSGYAYLADNNWGFWVLQYGSRITGQVHDVNDVPYPGLQIGLATTMLTTTTGLDGRFAFDELDPGLYTLTPTLPGYAFWPENAIFNLPPDANQPFCVLPAPVSTSLAPQQALRLVYTDTQGLPTRFDFLVGTVDLTTTISITPTVSSNLPGMDWAGHAFDLEVVQNGLPQPDLVFAAAVTVTLRYSDADARLLSDDSALALRWFDGSQWVPAEDTCAPAAGTVPDPDDNLIVESICKVGRYALFGPTETLDLPYISR